jgi:acyl-CoA thioesterase
VQRSTMATDVESYFVRVGEHRFRPTRHTAGAWSNSEQHFSPLGGLLTHVIERFTAARGEDDLVTARITFDILGTVAIDEFDVTVEVIRPGRTIELLEASAYAGGRAVVRGRAWRVIRVDTTNASGGQPERLPPPTALSSTSMTSTWPGGYIASLDVRPIGDARPGRGAAWIRTSLDLIADEQTSELARFVALVDTANGVAPPASPRAWFYPNVDLSIHFHRQPAGPWVGLDVEAVFGPQGQGLTSTVLHDVDGPVGRAEQTLTIRPRVAPDPLMSGA